MDRSRSTVGSATNVPPRRPTARRMSRRRSRSDSAWRKREPVDAEPGGELTLGRKTVAGLEIARVDRLLDHVADLGVERAFGTRDAAQPVRSLDRPSDWLPPP